MRPLAFLVGALALNAAGRRPSRRVPVAARKRSPVVLPPVKVPASATGASAVGRSLRGRSHLEHSPLGRSRSAQCIGRLDIRKARLREVEIDSLTVRKLKVTEELAMEPDSTKP